MGTEAFWVPAAISALGTGVQYENTQSANNRAQNSEAQSIMDQMNLQNKGASAVNRVTQQIATDTPQQIADKATGQYVDVLRKNAAGTQTGSGNTSSILFGQPTSSLPSNIKASSRYGTDTAASQAETQSYGNQLAGEMGQIDAATRQRQNEGLAQEGLGTNLNLLNGESYTKNFVNQLRTSTAGQSSPWLTLLSGALNGAGSTLSKNIGPSTPATAGGVIGDGSIGGQYGLPGSPTLAPQAPQLWNPTVPQ
jgi:hypothetical protein